MTQRQLHYQDPSELGNLEHNVEPTGSSRTWRLSFQRDCLKPLPGGWSGLRFFSVVQHVSKSSWQLSFTLLRGTLSTYSQREAFVNLINFRDFLELSGVFTFLLKEELHCRSNSYNLEGSYYAVAACMYLVPAEARRRVGASGIGAMGGCEPS